MLLHQEVSEYDLCLQLYSLQPGDRGVSPELFLHDSHQCLYLKKQETTTTIRKIIVLRFKGTVTSFHDPPPFLDWHV